ncbi:hypothetical protein F5B19DRAFT_280106 [Rostrohypoxylon terebratum]|nr:hypothetical protein F5B19DRAFT_280106 [Rostrohypoxylon terebratum]
MNCSPSCPPRQNNRQTKLSVPADQTAEPCYLSTETTINLIAKTRLAKQDHSRTRIGPSEYPNLKCHISTMRDSDRHIFPKRPRATKKDPRKIQGRPRNPRSASDSVEPTEPVNLSRSDGCDDNHFLLNHSSHQFWSPIGRGQPEPIHLLHPAFPHIHISTYFRAIRETLKPFIVTYFVPPTTASTANSQKSIFNAHRFIKLEHG